MGERHKGDCEQAIRAVYEYLDNEIEVTEQLTITQHLRRCRGCADAVEFERLFLARIRQACPESPPPALIEKVKTLLRQAEEGLC